MSVNGFMFGSGWKAKSTKSILKGREKTQEDKPTFHLHINPILIPQQCACHQLTCGKVSEKETCVVGLNETVPSVKGKRVMFVFLKREATVTMNPGRDCPLSQADDESGIYAPLMVFDCGGYEPDGFIFGSGWNAKSTKSLLKGRKKTQEDKPTFHLHLNPIPIPQQCACHQLYCQGFVPTLPFRLYRLYGYPTWSFHSCKATTE